MQLSLVFVCLHIDTRAQGACCLMIGLCRSLERARSVSKLTSAHSITQKINGPKSGRVRVKQKIIIDSHKTSKKNKALTHSHSLVVVVALRVCNQLKEKWLARMLSIS